jgi:CheY-like chemotaxis protein
MRRKKLLQVYYNRTALMIERMLLGDTYDLVTARDGQEAVAKARAELPDLVVMDVVMPEMNGLEACQRLRAEASTRAIPIILATTRGQVESLQTGFEHGCSDYVTKPLGRTELLTKIKVLLGE